MLNRRRFLATLGAITGASLLRRHDALAGVLPTRRLERIGIQAYTVRELLKTDFARTLSRLGRIGYREIEWWGDFGKSPSATRAALKRAGLTSPSGHFDFSEVRDHTARVLDRAAGVGHEYVTAAWIDEKDRKSAGDWRRIADRMNRLGEQARAAGRRFAYHNHDYEFRPVDGEIPLDILLSCTAPPLVSFELDIYWMVTAGADPVTYIRRHPGRFVMLHVKDAARTPKREQVDVGSGSIDFAAIFRAAKDHGNSIRYAFVEHDEPANPMAFAKKSFDYLKRLEY